MKVIARRRHRGGFQHDVVVRQHTVPVDEPAEQGGTDTAPSPEEMLAASLASCAAVTMEMYARRKGWDVGAVEVDCGYRAAERGCPTRFGVTLRFPGHLTGEQVERLRIIAAKCPVHRVLDGEVMFDERVEVLSEVS